MAAPSVHAVVGAAPISGSCSTLTAPTLPRRGRRSACGARTWPPCGPPAILPSRLPPRCRSLQSAKAALSVAPLAVLVVSWLFLPAAAPSVARSPAAALPPAVSPPPAVAPAAVALLPACLSLRPRTRLLLAKPPAAVFWGGASAGEPIKIFFPPVYPRTNPDRSWHRFASSSPLEFLGCVNTARLPLRFTAYP